MFYRQARAINSRSGFAPACRHLHARQTRRGPQRQEARMARDISERQTSSLARLFRNTGYYIYMAQIAVNPVALRMAEVASHATLALDGKENAMALLQQPSAAMSGPHAARSVIARRLRRGRKTQRTVNRFGIWHASLMLRRADARPRPSERPGGSGEDAGKPPRISKPAKWLYHPINATRRARIVASFHGCAGTLRVLPWLRIPLLAGENGRNRSLSLPARFRE